VKDISELTRVCGIQETRKLLEQKVKEKRALATAEKKRQCSRRKCRISRKFRGRDCSMAANFDEFGKFDVQAASEGDSAEGFDPRRVL